MDHVTIGKVARAANTGVETIRYYEREGLIAAPARSGSGYRQYVTDAIQRLRFIREAKDLGFSLKEIKELLSLRVEPGLSFQNQLSPPQKSPGLSPLDLLPYFKV